MIGPLDGDAGFRVVLFGGPELRRGARTVPLSALESTLLGVVAAHGRAGVARSKLLSFLWDHGSEAQLRRRLSQLAYSLRKRLGGTNLIVANGYRYMLDRDVATSDLEDAILAQTTGRLSEYGKVLGQGLLSNLRSAATRELETWIDQEQAHLCSELAALAAREGETARAESDWVRSQDAAKAMLQLEPTAEVPLRQLLKATALLGFPDEATARYRDFAQRATQNDPGWSPSDETTKLVERLAKLSRSEHENVVASKAQWPVPRMVGRQEELRLVVSCLGLTTPEDPISIHISGGRGVGKTRLLEEALEQLSLQEATTLVAQCSELEQEIPFASIAKLLLGTGSLATSEPWSKLLESVAPATCFSIDSSHPTSDPRIGFANGAIRRFLEQLVGDGPLVVCIDDLQWADSASLSAFLHLVERWQGDKLAFICAFRDPAIDDDARLGRWLRASERLRCDTLAIPLERLTDRDIEELLRQAVGSASCGKDDLAEADCEWLRQIVGASEGIPLVAVECLRACRERETDASDPPQAVQEVVLQRLDALCPIARYVVDVLSVCKWPIPLSTLESVCELPKGEVSSGVDQAAERGLLSVSYGGVELANPVVKDAVLGSLPIGQSTAIHRRIGQALVRRGQPALATAIAWHFLAAGELLEALPYVTQGARQAISSHQWREAEALLRATVGAAPQGPYRGTLNRLFGWLLPLLGEFAEAVRHWAAAEQDSATVGERNQALECRIERLKIEALRPETDLNTLLLQLQALQKECGDRQLPVLVADCMQLEIRVLDALRKTDDVPGVAAEARRRAGVGNSDAALRFLSASMIDAIYGAPQVACDAAEEAFGLAVTLGSEEMALEALNWWIIAYYHQSKLNCPEGGRLISKAVDVSSSALDVKRRFQLEANLGVWHMDAGNHDAADRAFGRAAEVLGSLPAPHLRRNLFLNRGELALEKSEYSEARRYFKLALSPRKVAAYEPLRCTAIAGLGLAELFLGSLSAARAAFAKLPPLPERWTFDPFLWLSLSARLMLIAGESGGALAHLRKHEERLVRWFPTAAMRLKLLRFRLGSRSGQSPREPEVRPLRDFLLDHRLGLRLAELDRLVSPMS